MARVKKCISTIAFYRYFANSRRCLSMTSGSDILVGMVASHFYFKWKWYLISHCLFSHVKLDGAMKRAIIIIITCVSIVRGTVKYQSTGQNVKIVKIWNSLKSWSSRIFAPANTSHCTVLSGWLNVYQQHKTWQHAIWSMNYRNGAPRGDMVLVSSIWLECYWIYRCGWPVLSWLVWETHLLSTRHKRCWFGTTYIYFLIVLQ